MSRGYKFVRKNIVMIVVLCMAILSPSVVVQAGGINGNEAGVISAASGTFTYNGKEYKAGSAYINSLTGYLSADAIDLTAEQASEAIAMMYANVAQGVEQGYLYEVGAGGETSTETSTEETSGDMEDATEDDWADAEVEDDSTEDKKGDSTNSSQQQSELDVWEAMSTPTENKNKLEERPEKEDASAAVELEDDGIVVTTKDDEAISIPKDKPIVSDSFVCILTVVAGIIFGITIICGIILFAKKCMSFKKSKGRKARPGHSKRRKIRHYTRAVLTVTTAISLIGIALLLGLYVSLFNNDAIMQNMQSSGYFRYAYSQYVADQAANALTNIKDGKGLEETPKLQTYDEYLFTIKQNSLKVLNGNMEIVIPDSNVAPYIYNLKTSYVEIFVKAGISLILSTIFGILLMVFMDQKRERGVKHTAVSVLIASGVMAVLTLVMLIYKPYTLLYIEPDYLYLFLIECIKRCVTSLTSITAFCVVLGMLVLGVYKMMKNNTES
ncbi:MAG: hypothetical protein IJD40_05745 [Lachnospiraceae bacterium]|nr:hypothetical protein [Lachnospiraceae bacterium]